MRIDTLQTDKAFEQRTADQIKSGHVDTGQFIGGKELFEVWQSCSSQSKLIDIGSMPLDHHDPVTVVDLGPGTGIPFNQISKEWPVTDGVLVDVSKAMIEAATQTIQAERQIPLRGIVADFVRDDIREHLQQAEANVILCLGNTIGNYNQQMILTTLSGMLREDDRAIIGVRLYSGEVKIARLAEFFASKANNVFGTHFLRKFGAKEGKNYSQYEDEGKEHGVKLIRVFHEFDDDTLKIAGETLQFPKGHRIQYLGSREYNHGTMPMLLAKYGLDCIQSQVKGNRGIYLCKKA